MRLVHEKCLTLGARRALLLLNLKRKEQKKEQKKKQQEMVYLLRRSRAGAVGKLGPNWEILGLGEVFELFRGRQNPGSPQMAPGGASPARLCPKSGFYGQKLYKIGFSSFSPNFEPIWAKIGQIGAGGEAAAASGVFPRPAGEIPS